MPSMTVIAPDLILGSVEYEPKQSITRDSDSMCLGEIRKFQSP